MVDSFARLDPGACLKLNEAAPAFDISTLHGGRIRLSDYRGKWLTLYFWHSGSPGSTCEMELRYLKMLRSSLA
jgi:peroxiredoxin